ncbi:MAG: DJ-1/PfpI family protein [Chloroflexi bacterium]|nr:DJ-1/PfpI family protein [Chloroflexota bacterium]
MAEGKRVAILTETGFQEIELRELTRAMRDMGFRVDIVGASPGETYKGSDGEATIRVDVQGNRARVDEFDAIIVPGLNAGSRMHLSQTAIDLIKEADSRAKIIAAIGYAPRLLISAQIAQGRRVTSAPELAESLKEAGTQWVDFPVVRDRNLITARKLVDLPRFCKAIIEAVGVDF